MSMDMKRFFDEARSSSLFGGKLTTKQVEGMSALITEWGTNNLATKVQINQLAYILGTVYHEVGDDMVPVREGFCPTDECSIKHVTALFKQKKISTNYALPDKVTGKSYFGRGHVQTTWSGNYKRVGKLIGLGDTLYYHPERMLESSISAKVAIKGMIGGWFTGHMLREYFNESEANFVQARYIINGKDKRDLIASYAIKFQGILIQATI